MATKKKNGYWKTEKVKRCRTSGVEEGCIEHMTHMRNKIGVGAVINERGKGKALRWMREVKKLKKVYRRGIESVKLVKRICKPSPLTISLRAIQ